MHTIKRPFHRLAKRQFSTNIAAHAELDLKQTLQSVIPKRREQFLNVRKQYGNKPLAQTTVASTLGGMRGSPALYWESSKVDPDKGVTFHGRTIEECQQVLPHSRFDANDPNSEFLPESMFWFLLTGQIPSQAQVDSFSRTIAEQGETPEYILKILDTLPATLHPMSQLSIAITALNNNSSFAKAYEKGVSKYDFWEYAFDDAIDLIAKLPQIIGRIYQNTYHRGISSSNEPLGTIDSEKDWSYNLASALGFNSNTAHSRNIQNFNGQESNDFVNLVRLYCALHGDHEGGNVSSHTTHLVGSALSDPYLSYSAGVQGLAGPLHGLAAQEVVRFILALKEDLKLNDVSALLNNKEVDSSIVEYLWSILKSGRVIPGYGHAVLRKPDPRFDAMLQFGLKRPDTIMNKDVNFQLVHKLSQVAPEVLKQHGKTKNPFPNVDSSSGVLFYHYGLTQTLFFTVIFAGSRALGPLSQLIWDRILGLPIERPKSLDLESIIKRVE